MCGIVGAISRFAITPLLLSGLKRLEYRGYDSAGIAIIDKQQKLHRIRVKGKVKILEAALSTKANTHFSNSRIGIAHTRWATHGVPSENNAHPLISKGEVAVVHNGIIENHAELRDELTQLGYTFESETDTETAVHLIHFYLTSLKDLFKAVKAAAQRFRGAYALCVMSTSEPTRLIGVRNGAPLVIGLGEDENFIASDPIALLSATQNFIFLEDNDIVDLSIHQVQIFEGGQIPIVREKHSMGMSSDAIERGEYRHYMLKEIFEQPRVIQDCLTGRINDRTIENGIFDDALDQKLKDVEHIYLIACGTSYHSALIAKYWIEELAHIPCNVEVASEFRYRQIAPMKNGLFVSLSQSGETADALAALRLAKKSLFLHDLVFCNVSGSTMVREASSHFLIHAGVEIGVASTKAFVNQLISLLIFSLNLRRAKNLSDELDTTLIAELNALSQKITAALKTNQAIADWAHAFTDKTSALFLGRGFLYPIALEGALKMKEISYIHAEGYPAGELKHGPLALVDPNIPVIATVPYDDLMDKTLSNLQEVNSRGGKLFVFSDEKSATSMIAGTKIIQLPTIHRILSPILYTIPLQLLSYHVAVLKGTDVDQPRNLAKSVTVE